MRFFLTADLQLRNFTEFSTLTPLGYNSRLVKLLSELDRLIHEHGPFEGIILAGDIFNNKASLETDLLDLVHQYFRKWSEGSEIISLLGNHDTALLNANIHSLRQFESYGKVITQPEIYKGIAFSPWRPLFEQIQTDINFLAGKARVLVGHWQVKGAQTNNYMAEEGISPVMPALARFERVLLGHIHKTQQLGKNIRYLGSPAQNDFGEEGDEKRVWVLDMAKEISLAQIPITLPKYKTVNSLPEAQAARQEGYYVRLKAKSREELREGTKAGLRVEQDFAESVAAADSVRALVNTLEDAVKAYAIANQREDLLPTGIGFLSGALEERTVPPVKITFKRLRAENFLSYQSLDWDLSARTGLVIIHGEVLSDSAYDSNGAGKTALYEAIYYALYGVTLRYGARKELTIRQGEKKNSVSIAFDLTHPFHGTNHVVITRSRPGAVKLAIDGADATCSDSALTQKSITRLVGNPEFFLRLTLLALHYHPSFLQLTDPEKKRFIDEFSGLDAFSEAREGVSRELATLEVEERRVQFDQNRLAERATLLAHRAEEIELELAQFQEAELRAAVERKTQIGQLEKELAALKAPDKLKLPDSGKLQAEITQHEATLSQARQALESQRQNQSETLWPLQTKAHELDNEVKTLREGLALERCPTCQRPFTKAKETNRVLNQRIETFSKEHAALQEERDRLSASFLREDRDFTAEIRTLESHVRDLHCEVARLKEVEHTMVRRYEVALSLYDSSRERLQEKIQTIRAVKPGDTAPLQAHLAEARANAREAGKELTLTEKKLATFQSDKAKLEFWLVGFGNRGCKSLLYTALIDRLNGELAQICNLLSGGTLQLRLLPYAESAKGELLERISLEVSNFLGANILEGDSLGERNRIDIAVALALRRVLTAFSAYSASVLFIDEPWVGLDNSGKASVYALLESEARSCLVFATDQDKSTKGFSEGRILTVRKSERVSTLAGI